MMDNRLKSWLKNADAAMVELEITESIAIDNLQKSIQTLGEIRAIEFELY
ncbi:MAG: EAL domain-containing protein (putative c-di-GMP-specific phosphodiesterase class I) [Paraglaciecola sp.]|jgi:EAL domain-containing protein (putative c-di-GMP-specific phosphodiesterase class I)